MKPSPACIELIKHFEAADGPHLAAYLCPAGIPTIGYGSTRWEDGRRVQLGETITAERAERLMRAESNAKAMAVERLVRVVLDQDQFDALVSFAYNLGEGYLAKSTLLKVVNNGALLMVHEQLPRHIKAGGVPSFGLLRRRLAESAMFAGFNWEAFRL